MVCNYSLILYDAQTDNITRRPPLFITIIDIGNLLFTYYYIGTHSALTYTFH